MASRRIKSYDFIKQPWEAYYLNINFEGKIDSRTAVTIAPTATLNGRDATAALLDPTLTYQNGEYIYFWVKENLTITAGKYKIRLRVTLSDDTQLEEDAYLEVEDL